MVSPAERFAAAKKRASNPVLNEFLRYYSFPLDPFQLAACAALQQDRGVLVAAPTGAGKTVVGEFAVHLALEAGKSCFYTTPIKALSNQKYNDLADRYGHDRVGLLTGDNSINSDAPIVVMTTEVLRNMIYARSRSLLDLAHVVMDEVHYLADRSRGAVWEEVLINLPDSVVVTALSATVSNAEEFGHWLGLVRGSTDVIVEEYRPVPLWQQVLAGQHLHDLFVDADQAKVNPELLHKAAEEAKFERSSRGSHRAKGRHGRGRPGGRGNDRVSRPGAVRRLDQGGLLPAIYFIFSRAGCDAAVEQCLRAGVQLTDDDERDAIRDYAEWACGRVDPADLSALNYESWLYALERGIAAHHAGLVPVFKEVVEALFQRGLVKCVFATETLALGINMPARSVVLERLVKWNGEAHVDLTPGEYTQLTGRAGRRGIDVEGHAVVAWHRGLDPRMLAGLASTRTYPLRSSFRPSYNMAVNLVATTGRDRAGALLESSFAQYQSDSAVVDIAAEARRNEEAMAGYQEAMECHLGEFSEYAALRDQLKALERDGDRQNRARRRQQTEASLRELRRGEIVRVARGRRSGPVVIVETASADAETDPRVVAVDLDRRTRRLGLGDFPQGVAVLGRVRVPKSFNSRSANSRSQVAQSLREVARDLPDKRAEASGGDDELGAQIDDLRRQLRQHPCHGCDDRERHARWGERYHKLRRRTEKLQQRIDSRTNTIARQFDRICGLLTGLGYLDDSGQQVTDSGRMLARIYGDTDLVVAESLRQESWVGMKPETLACLCAALVYESRGRDDGSKPRLPGGEAGEALDRLVDTWERLAALESDHKLQTLPAADLGLCWPMFRWARGHALDSILWESDLTAGDFVRWSKQVIDLLGQIMQAQPGSAVADAAKTAAGLVDRGVVAYSGVRE
ncbi:MAG: DEAD/DEAH box helicase [Actinomycetia bacterium]|nr:DEAD/DEAH box helicase [Actinomycetes bacterium]MCH9800403.1 DEAD/DEAH box helicase [Actinomycetes bacterium]